MIRLVHVIKDNKFINSTYEVFNSLSRTDLICKYVFITQDRQYTFKNLKEIVSSIDVLHESEFLDYLNQNSINAIMLHGLNLVDTLPYINNSIKIFWFAWGYDIYSYPSHNPFIPLKLYKPLTKRYSRDTFLNQLRILHGKFDTLCKYKKIRRAISRIDYFSGIIPDEYMLMKKNHYFKAKEVVFNYFSIDDVSYDDINQPYCGGNAIQVGNSANPTNNHIDLYKSISKLNLDNTKVYSFLSYSGPQFYIKNVEKYGEKSFGSDFVAITDFLSYSEYTKIVQECSVVVMGHIRQQAMGSIYTSIWLGCKVFLYEDSIAYKYLKRLGFLIFTIEKDLTKKGIEGTLSNAEKLYNRKKYLEYHSKEKHFENLNRIIDLIDNVAG